RLCLRPGRNLPGHAEVAPRSNARVGNGRGSCRYQRRRNGKGGDEEDKEQRAVSLKTKIRNLGFVANVPEGNSRAFRKDPPDLCGNIFARPKSCPEIFLMELSGSEDCLLNGFATNGRINCPGPCKLSCNPE